MPDLPRISAADLAVQEPLTPLIAEDGELRQPVWLVDLAREDQDAARFAAACRTSSRLLIGVDADRSSRRETRAALDVTYAPASGNDDRSTVEAADPWAAATALGQRALASPQATLVLRRTLRIGEHLDVHDAIDVESLGYSTLLAGGEYQQWLATRRPLREAPAVERAVIVERPTEETLIVRLDRPERRNAYGRQLRDELMGALQIAQLDPRITRIELAGNGPVFCSGGDLGDFGVTDDPAHAHLVRTTAGAAHRLAALVERTIVHVHGASVGAGVELAAFAGTVVADPAATFRLPEVEMGLIPGAGGTASLPRRIGRWRTTHLVVGNHLIDAEQALAWGLVDHVTSSCG